MDGFGGEANRAEWGNAVPAPGPTEAIMMTKSESAETQQDDTGKLIAVVNGRG